MARTARLSVPHLPHHVAQQGNNREQTFIDDDDRAAFLHWLRLAAKQFAVRVHAYALLDNQWQMLATPPDDQALGRMMQWLGRHYVPYFNKKYARTGALWQGRFRASVLEPDRYPLLCSCYIERLPVLMGLASEPEAYAWSSCSHHTGMKPDAWLSDHVLYWAMGNTPFSRELAYRQAVQSPLSEETFAEISHAILRGKVLGSLSFQSELEFQLQRPVREGRRGRPPKPL